MMEGFYLIRAQQQTPDGPVISQIRYCQDVHVCRSNHLLHVALSSFIPLQDAVLLCTKLQIFFCTIVQ